MCSGLELCVVTNTLGGYGCRVWLCDLQDRHSICCNTLHLACVLYSHHIETVLVSSLGLIISAPKGLGVGTGLGRKEMEGKQGRIVRNKVVIHSIYYNSEYFVKYAILGFNPPNWGMKIVRGYGEDAQVHNSVSFPEIFIYLTKSHTHVHFPMSHLPPSSGIYHSQ